MREADRRRFRIDNVNGAAIGNMNAERNLTLVCDDRVAAGNRPVRLNRLIHDGDLVRVNLLDGHQRPVAETGLAPETPVFSVQALQGFGLILTNINSGNACDEGAANESQRIQSRKILERLQNDPTSLVRRPTLASQARAHTR